MDSERCACGMWPVAEYGKECPSCVYNAKLLERADAREQESVNRFLRDHRHDDDSTRLGNYLARKEPWRNEE